MNNERWARVERLYHAALAVKREDRPAFLKKECSNDEVRREVESLLVHDGRELEILERPILADAPGIETATVEIANGASLGPYRVIGRLGSGGMGVVYLAHDPRLNRRVAVKVSEERFGKRFEAEARAVAALNHPGICAVYDVGPNYLVMEYLEGETLATRLAKGPLPTDAVMRYAITIAEALAHAHQHGILHRDLKPGNLMLTKSGVKLVDFGLAKNSDPSAGDLGLTSPGAILGTVPYMAPEQLEGKKTDTRSDIFSFGAVMYEMATGKRAFEGTTQAAVIAAIMECQSVSICPKQTELETVINACLEKDPDARWHCAHDLSRELKRISSATPPAAEKVPKSREMMAWATAAVAVFVCAVTLIFSTRSGGGPGQRNSFRFLVQPPQDALLSRSVFKQVLSLSPDGRRLAFVAARDGKSQVWVRALDAMIPTLLAGTDGAELVFWSPDSQYVGFFADRKFKRVPASGGLPDVICESATNPWSATWMGDGSLVFGDGASTYSFAASTSHAPKRLDKLLMWPQAMPDGEHILAIRADSKKSNFRVYLEGLHDPNSEPLMESDSAAWYSPPVNGSAGYILYARGSTLLARPVDGRTFRLVGEAITVAEHVWTFQSTGAASFTVSANGVLAYQTSAKLTRLSWLDRAGREVAPFAEPAEFFGPMRISPDGSRVAAATKDGPSVWVYDTSRQVSTRLGPGAYPVWSPDGRRLVYAISAAGPPKLFWRGIGETGDGTPLDLPQFFQLSSDWSPDGRFVLYQTTPRPPDDSGDVWLMPTSGAKTPVRLIHSEFANSAATFSPDMAQVAFVANDSGRPEVYVQGFSDHGAFALAGERYRISTNGGARPRWSRNGRELFFVDGGGTLQVVAVRPSPSDPFEGPEPLFRIPEGGQFDVSLDGKRFLVLVRKASDETPIDIDVNWQPVGRSR